MTVPPPGKGLSVRVDEETHEALMTLCRAGMTPTQAVRQAVRLLANAHTNAWDTGEITDGFEVRVMSMRVQPYDAYPIGGQFLSYEEATRITKERRKAAAAEKERNRA